MLIYDDLFLKLVTESFRDFCKSEILTGENLYDAGSIHGLQVCCSSKKFFICLVFFNANRKRKKVLNSKNFLLSFVYISYVLNMIIISLNIEKSMIAIHLIIILISVNFSRIIPIVPHLRINYYQS